MKLHNHVAPRHSAEVKERFSLFSEGESVQCVARRTLVHNTSTLLSRKAMRIRLHSNSPSPTIITTPDNYIHPQENRVPTVREMARLQSFKDAFVFLGKRVTGGLRRQHECPQYTQVGNAVPPMLAKAIAESLRRHLL